MKVLVSIFLVSAVIISIVALFLNINTSVGLSSAGHVQLNVVGNVLNMLLGKSRTNLETLSTLNGTDINYIGLVVYKNCKQYVLDRIPSATETFVPFDLSFANPALPTLAVGTGVIHEFGTGMVNISGGEPSGGGVSVTWFSKSIAIGHDASIPYIELPSSPTLYYTAQNMTEELFLNDWYPPIYEAEPLVEMDRIDPMYDLQRVKIQTAPDALLFSSRSYNGTEIKLGSAIEDLSIGDVVGITRNIQMGF